MGDIQVEGLDYFEKYSPVVSCTTVRLMLILSINQVWATRQVDLSNIVFQATLGEDVYTPPLPYYFYSDTGEDIANMVMKLNKSLYRMVQHPLYWYNHMKGNFEARCFKPSHLYPCIFYGKGMIALIYVDDVLLFGPDQDKIY